MKYPNIFRIQSLMDRQVATFINGKYVAARPLGFQSFRIRVKAAWMVFTGKADAVIWEEAQ